jgi:hypothetical protein
VAQKSLAAPTGRGAELPELLQRLVAPPEVSDPFVVAFEVMLPAIPKNNRVATALSTRSGPRRLDTRQPDEKRCKYRPRPEELTIVKKRGAKLFRLLLLHEYTQKLPKLTGIKASSAARRHCPFTSATLLRATVLTGRQAYLHEWASD